MPTNYPGALDSFTDPSDANVTTSPSHSAQHTNVNDAIVAIETELGINPSSSASTVSARVAAVETVVSSGLVTTGGPTPIPALVGWQNATAKPTGFATGTLFAKWQSDGSGGRTLLGWSF